MELVQQYIAQDRWRQWDRMLAEVPVLDSDTVLDLGCGPGSVTARLASRAYQVIGVDRDPGLLKAARQRCPSNCRFVEGDVRDLGRRGLGQADGIWSSFLPAYFPELGKALQSWLPFLGSNGWIALVEVDRMLAGHHPLPDDVRSSLDEFETFMRASRLYDFGMGSKLKLFVQGAGLEVVHESVWEDAELAFQGAAPPEMIEAWRHRFARMKKMQGYFRNRFAPIRDRFLECLSSPLHPSDASLVLVIARKR